MPAALARTRIWIVRGLRIATLTTLCATLALYVRTPAGAYLADASQDRIEARLATVLAARFDQAWLDTTLDAALADAPVNWTLIDSATAIAADRDLTPASEVAARLASADARDRGALGLAANCLRCAVGDAACRMADGLACAIGAELTPIGDARVLIAQGAVHASGGEVDRTGVALAAIGLGATLAIVATAGGSAAVKGGAALLKLARRTGRLTPGLQALLVRIGRDIVRWNALPRSPRALIDPAAYRAAVNAPVAAAGMTLATDLDRIRRAMPTSHALVMLGHIDTAGDAHRVARLSAVAGPRSVAVLHHLGKTRALRLTARYSRAARTLIALGAALAGLALALGVMLGQSVLARLAVRALR